MLESKNKQKHNQNANANVIHMPEEWLMKL
jgi:hypothetical protein